MDTFFAAAGQLFVNIRNQIQMITISDIIDIAIIAYIAYRMLLLVRHSRGAQVAKAIVLLLAALVLSNAFRLNVVNFILSKTVELGLLALVVVFQLITLPVEFNASRRAIAIIGQQAMLSSEELQGAKKVLTAAALTYVASLLVSLANLLRLVLLFGRRRND